MLLNLLCFNVVHPVRKLLHQHHSTKNLFKKLRQQKNKKKKRSTKELECQDVIMFPLANGMKLAFVWPLYKSGSCICNRRGCV